MRNLSFIILFSLLFVFTGCSTKEVSKKDTTQIKKEQKVKDSKKEDAIDDEFAGDDEFLEEFEEEMKVEEKSDPFSGYNRVMTSFNDGLYEYVLTPVANGYQKVVHKEVRSSVKKFFHNLMYPVRLVNNLLQGKFKNSAEETGRFVINTTVGLLGFFDPAKSVFDLEPHNEDFGQTLGYWGVGPGPHIVLPFFGPSNLRDTFSMYPDSLADPIDYHSGRSYNLTNNYGESLLLKAYKKVNEVSLDGGQYQKLKEDAVDLYPYLRDVYEQYREKQIKE